MICTRTGSSAGEYLSAFSKRLTRTRSICPGSACTAGGYSGSSTECRFPGAAVPSVHRPDAGLGCRCPCLEPRKIEQVVDQAVEAPCFRDDRGGELPLVVAVELEVVLGKRAGRREHRHERRAQVMADGAKDGGLGGT